METGVMHSESGCDDDDDELVYKDEMTVTWTVILK